MSIERFSNVADLTMRQQQPGFGMAPFFRCFGCNQNRPGLGSKGRGLFKRCGVCVAKKAAKS